MGQAQFFSVGWIDSFSWRTRVVNGEYIFGLSWNFFSHEPSLALSSRLRHGCVILNLNVEPIEPRGEYWSIYKLIYQTFWSFFSIKSHRLIQSVAIFSANRCSSQCSVYASRLPKESVTFLSLPVWAWMFCKLMQTYSIVMNLGIHPWLDIHSITG